jgi:hypothetical protein
MSLSVNHIEGRDALPPPLAYQMMPRLLWAIP